VIDDTLNFFRANVLFRNFDIRGGADRTMIYLTLFTVMCLVKAEKIEDKAAGMNIIYKFQKRSKIFSHLKTFILHFSYSRI
jgi:hypothetical protein